MVCAASCLKGLSREVARPAGPGFRITGSVTGISPAAANRRVIRAVCVWVLDETAAKQGESRRKCMSKSEAILDRNFD